MRIRCLFFASYRDLMDADELELELPADARVGDVVAALRKRPGADALPAAPAVAVNQEYASPQTLLQEGDEVAFIPPVAGG